MLSSIEYGSGPPVILLHGLLGSKINMAGIAKYLSDRFHTIAVDQRNHGDSFHHRSMNYRSMAADIGGFMDDHDIESASLVGHSMGGKCAMQFALSFPERVHKLAVVDIAPRQYTEPHWVGYVKAMLSLDPAALESRKQADALLKEDIPSPIYRQFLLGNLASIDNGGYRWRPNLDAIMSAQNDICAAVTGAPNSLDTLFVRGGNSTYIRDSDRQSINRLFPEADLINIENSGHLVHIEARDRFHQLLVEFL